MAVGIMIVPPQKFGEGMEMENRYTLINIENIKVGNIIERPNGNRVSFSIVVVQMVLVHLAVVRTHKGRHFAGRRVPDQSHKLCFPISSIGPATKKVLK